MYDYIIFDLDGTLIDSASGILASLQYAFNEEGIDVSHLNLKSIIGPPLPIGLKHLLPHMADDEIFLQRLISRIRNHYSEIGAKQSLLYPGVKEVLSELLAQNKCLYIATSKPEVIAKEMAYAHGISELFTTIAGNVIEGIPKTKSEIIATAIANLSLAQKKKSVMIGDRYHDLHGAQENGIDAIAVSYGYGELQEFASYQPIGIVSDVYQLKKHICSS